MIGKLRGVIDSYGEDYVILDVQGVGYEVHVPLSTFYVVGDPGMRVVLRVHTHVREDVIALYGFATRLEQELFELGQERISREQLRELTVRVIRRGRALARALRRRGHGTVQAVNYSPMTAFTGAS